MVALADPDIGVPAVGLDLAKELIVFHHPRAAWFVMLEMDKASIAELLAPARQVLRDNMGMYIYFERHASIGLAATKNRFFLNLRGIIYPQGCGRICLTT